LSTLEIHAAARWIVKTFRRFPADVREGMGAATDTLLWGRPYRVTPQELYDRMLASKPHPGHAQ
jgi:hypothetical protein